MQCCRENRFAGNKSDDIVSGMGEFFPVFLSGEFTDMAAQGLRMLEHELLVCECLIRRILAIKMRGSVFALGAQISIQWDFRINWNALILREEDDHVGAFGSACRCYLGVKVNVLDKPGRLNEGT